MTTAPATLARPVHAATSLAPKAYSWQRSLPRTAGVRRRAVALGFDLVLVFVITWTIAFAAETLGLLSVPDVVFMGQTNAALGLLWIVSIFELPILLVYFTLLEGAWGRTPGKLVTGIAVRHVDGSKPGLFDAFLRNLLRLLWVTPFGPAFILMDAWSLSATELDQRMGDLVSETVVVLL